MTQESKTEIVIFTGLAVFLGLLWWLNRSNGGGTGLEDVSLPDFPSAGSLPGVAGPGDTNFSVGGNTYGSSPPGGSTCGCQACSSNNGVMAFGSDADLTQYLAAAAPAGWAQSLIAATQAGGWN